MQKPLDAADERLEILDALARAIDRRIEVFDLISNSASADDARTALATLLQISDHAAVAVLDLQSRRFAQLERQRIVEERDSIRRSLNQS